MDKELKEYLEEKEMYRRMESDSKKALALDFIDTLIDWYNNISINECEYNEDLEEYIYSEGSQLKLITIKMQIMRACIDYDINFNWIEGKLK